MSACEYPRVDEFGHVTPCGKSAKFTIVRPAGMVPPSLAGRPVCGIHNRQALRYRSETMPRDKESSHDG